MYIQTDKDNNIIQLITVGSCPAENGYEIPDDTSEDILKNIFSYKYIDGEFVFKDDTTNIKLQNVINAKLQFLSKTCNEQIEKGIDYNGSHYSLNSNDDQINLIQLGFDAKVSIITGQPLEEPLMYHADGEECGNRLLVPVDIVIPDNRTRQPEYYSHLSTYGRRVMLDALNGLFRMALWSACSRFLLSRDSLNEAVEQWCRENGISVENREGVRQKLYRMRKQYQKIGIDL